MDDLLSEFLTETSESIATLDVELVHLEQNPNDRDILSNIFRLVHTIKGTCGFLGLPRLESLAHSGENVLGKFRDGELEVSAEAVTVILHTIDRIKDILTHLEQTESEPAGEDRDLKDQLAALAKGRSAGEAAPVAPAPAPAAEAPAAPGGAGGGGPALSAGGFPVAAELLAEVEEAVNQGKKAASEAELAAQMAAEADNERAAEAAKASMPMDEAKAAEAAASGKEPPPEPKAGVPARTEQPAAAGDGAKKDSVAAQSIRVNVDLLEKLMTLVSELVLTRNQLLQMVRGSDDSEFAAPLQRLSHITSDLQEGVMKTRMQPIGNAWAKLPRIVRDLATEMGKKIDLQMYGADTELDRQVLELIKDPLTHMVRNSGDHGLEMPDDRLNAGKPEVGVVKLNAYHEGGHIIIEISDDGRGLNLRKIKDKAIANGLGSEAEIEGMSDQQVAQFIFRAGLSTAEKVTSVSGRGVGMDVVRTNIEQIGGTVELKTWPGKGSTFIIKIPLTLAIVSGLIVESAGERFAIPQISVLELVRVTAKSDTKIERINRAPVLRLRDRLLPLVSLAVLLRLDEDRDDIEAEVNSQEETFIVVTQVGTYSFGIIVDRVFDTEEIVVKPVAPILRHISMFSGNTILGDGSVIMILDPNGIAGATGENTLGSGAAAEKAATRETHGDDTTSLLIFRAGSAERRRCRWRWWRAWRKSIWTRWNIQLWPAGGSVSRPAHAAGRRRRHDGHEDRGPPAGAGVLGPRTVHGTDGRRDRGYRRTTPEGRVEGRTDGRHRHRRHRRQGDRHHRYRPLPDAGLRRLVRQRRQRHGRGRGRPSGAAGGRQSVLPQPADAAAVRRRVRGDGPGLRAGSAGSGRTRRQIRGHHQRHRNARNERLRIRRGGAPPALWARTPMVALSSHATEKDLDRGRQAGFDDYVAKFDRESVLVSLKQLMREAAGLDDEEAEPAEV